MAEFPWLCPRAFSLSAGSVGCLLIHGFTGSPAELRPMGEHLHQRGLTVSAPLLPGHGTSPGELARAKWQDWHRCVETALEALQRRCTEAFVVGFSLGAVLGLHLAANCAFSGVVLLAPALWVRDWRSSFAPLLRFLVREVHKDPNPEHADLTDPEAYKRFWSYDVYPTQAVHQLVLLQRRVRSELPRIKMPTLIICSTRDMSVSPRSGPRIHQRVASVDKELVVFGNSGHGLVADTEREAVFQKVCDWVMAHQGRPSH